MRRETLGQTVQHGAARPSGPADRGRVAVDRRAVVGDQHLFRLGPLRFVKAGSVADFQRFDRISTQVEPVTELSHGDDYGDLRPVFSSRFSRKERVSRVGYCGWPVRSMRRYSAMNFA